MSSQILRVDTAMIPAVLLGSKFRAEGSGVYFGSPAEEEPLRICNTAIYIEAETRDENNENWGRLLTWRDSEGHEHSWTMPLSMLAGDTTAVLSKLMSDGVTIIQGRQPKELLLQYLQEPAHKRIRCCGQIGWYKGCFVLPNETIAPDGAEEIRFQTTSPSRFADLITKGSLNGWRETIGLWSAGNSRLVLAVSMAFGGPLLNIISEQGGGIHLVGTTSDGKTTAIRVSMSPIGSPKLMRNWRTTANGLEGIAWAHNHLTLGLDELAQIDPFQAEEAAYLLGNGQGKGRADQSGSARPALEWLLLYLSAGEITLADHAATVGKQVKAGAEVRCLNLASDAGTGHKLFENLHGFRDGATFSQVLKEAAEQNYGHPLRAFLRWLVDHRTTAEQEIRTAIDAFVQQNAAQASPEVQRAAKRFGLIAKAGELATRAGITGWLEGEATWGAQKCFHSYVELRGNVGESDTEKAVANVLAFIQKHGSSRFEDLGSGATQKIHNRAGFLKALENDEMIYYFLKNVFREEVCKGANHGKVAAVLFDRGLLQRDKDRWTYSVRLPGLGNTDVYAIVLRNPEIVRIRDEGENNGNNA